MLLYLPRVLRGGGSGGSISVTDGFALSVDGVPARVHIVQAEGADTVRLERGDAGWTVDGYAADQNRIDDLLGSITELSSTDLVARNPANHASMGVGDSGRRIDIYTDSGGPFSFHLGNRDLSAGGYFVRAPGQDPVLRLEGPVGGYLSRERDGWRPRQIAAVDTSAAREIVLRRDGGEAVVRRGEGGWTVADAPADSAAVDNLLRLLPGLSITGFPTEEEEAAADFTLPDAELDVFPEDAGDVTERQLVLSLRFIDDEERGDWLVRPPLGRFIGWPSSR